jgi:hypothetical protein
MPYYDAGNLFLTGEPSDEQLAGVLGGRVHPTAGQWLASWSELQAEG